MRGRTATRRYSVRPNAKFFIVIGIAVLAIVAVICFFVFSKNEIAVKEGNIPFEYEETGILVRDEKLYKAENYGKAVFLAQEGENVTKDTPIAEVYKWGYNDKVSTELLTLQEKIMEYQEQNLLKNVLSQDITSLNESISAKSKEIKAIINGDKDGNLIDLENELKQLMEQRVTFLDDSVVADDQLKDFYDEETALLERIDGLKQIINAESDGVVSFYFDGAETLLTPDNMLKLSMQNINDILEGRVYTQITDSDAARPLYRLVNNKKCYVMLTTSKKIDEFKQGTAFTVTFKEAPDQQYEAKVINMRDEQSGYIYYFEIDANTSSLINMRMVDMRIQKTFSGSIVPTSAIKTKDNKKGIYIVDGNEQRFITVNVLITKGTDCVVEPTDSSVVIEKGSIVVQ